MPQQVPPSEFDPARAMFANAAREIRGVAIGIGMSVVVCVGTLFGMQHAQRHAQQWKQLQDRVGQLEVKQQPVERGTVKP